MQKYELQGGAIAILYKGEVIYKTTFGNQKGNSGVITDKTLFPLASVSKAVSATAIALVVDQESLDFDEITIPKKCY
ncbi:serine hydrolase [Rickettsia amblyommatis]|uniref:Beta-lactamase AmpC n=2 Tax=Rickettsia amblyommatis TaxID=33989 RepID=H8K3M3_RICAG|nr:serine hydrolase domain-containing protein [Rickettsia amblyommatis]AFC69117.1 beta-lactamase AmpC [Rickettsia amblyommatis str. GAT-30V]KJV61300.1 beta-lactamase family protein [Rickettsia amblyommatis str. Ac/Pa]KJV97954.1 beta-lactamase family protein [Rickettsia amblyommatis str. Darkwater]